MVPATGRFVLMYHLLWELTHVCFEHPGLLKPTDEETVCVTCGDEGRLGEVVLEPADAVRRSSAQPKARNGSTSPCSGTSHQTTLSLCTPAQRSRGWTTPGRRRTNDYT